MVRAPVGAFRYATPKGLANSDRFPCEGGSVWDEPHTVLETLTCEPL
jgi:hypothetical protein